MHLSIPLWPVSDIKSKHPRGNIQTATNPPDSNRSILPTCSQIEIERRGLRGVESSQIWTIMLAEGNEKRALKFRMNGPWPRSILFLFFSLFQTIIFHIIIYLLLNQRSYSFIYYYFFFYRNLLLVISIGIFNIF